ncbi:MAG: DUF1566 domain-containing protein, partial [Deltaproteobacteria bacterium]|nr:DUF1566 domain-containing protein [Deltaproteobacteria bacterium]
LPKHGWLEVRSQPPGCRVLLNKREIGKTPIERYELAPGKYSVRVRHRCYQSLYKNIVIGRNEPAQAIFVLKPLMTTFNFSASDKDGRPLEAIVIVDDIVRAGEKGVYQVPLCSKRLRIDTQKYESMHDELVLKRRGTTYIHASASGVYRDPDSTLIWQKTPIGGGLPWKRAKEFCDRLILDGKTDWRMPNRDELKSLVKGCKLKYRQHYCPHNKGPGKNGCYWPQGLDGDCPFGRSPGQFWTASGNDSHANFINFGSGGVNAFLKTSPYGVRCVRGDIHMKTKDKEDFD